jgi:predicted metal-dependent peptidase
MIINNNNVIKAESERMLVKSVTPYKKESKKVKTAKKIMTYTAEKLKIRFHDLAYAISSMKPVAVKERLLVETDGVRFFYNPEAVISSYNLHRTDDLERQMVHIILHGLLGHFETGCMYRNYEFAWSIMDEQVWCMQQKLYGRENLSEAPDMGEYFRIKGKNKIKKWKNGHHAGADNHYLWYVNNQNEAKNQDKSQEKNQDKRSSQDRDFESVNEGIGSIKKKWSEIRSVLGVRSCGEDAVKALDKALFARDKSSSYGSGAGDENVLVENYGEADTDYRSLLKKLCREREQVKEDRDSFDYMLYNYGLEMYGDVPLIEPLETKEVAHFNTIVLAIDTSGSCSGEIARQFLSESSRMFSDITELAELEHLYILQCDFVVQDELRLDGAAEVVRYIERNSVSLKGFGGTDFCPVFDRVEEIREGGETIDALIYLTDGYGEYPEEKPDYPVYFVMDEEDFEHCDEFCDMPEWINKVKLGVSDEGAW